MAESLHYTKSPLMEAVIDIRVELSPSVGLDDLATALAEYTDLYPVRHDHVRFAGQVQLGEEIISNATRTHDGYIFVSSDSKQAVQARLDGFSFNRLAPYTEWKLVRDEARRLWTKYRECVQPTQIIRVAVRYINRLELPLPFADFKEYLRVTPEVPPDFPNGALHDYFMQLNMPQPDLLSGLILNQVLTIPTDVVPENPESLPIVLDIDLFREVQVPQNEDGLWDLFDQFRDRKNKVFEACLTERMKEVIR